ncbi:hypothetical protein [Noviherbaspirillum sp.]|uniref:hypothetical protein n=1 Tax=Noviherbaspirillum sp. TaxID=1926288 RepID=UPI002D3E7D6F|nr:hypothetical protein [Noviherbaspirillum sp.]HZW23359.1 hypothetical protein [Noviherbaspirillum sp.]
MQSEIFQFRQATTQQSMDEAVKVLSGVEGVIAVTPSLLRNELNVQFNADLASRQSLQAVLTDAGYAMQTAARTGGCGGGGGGCSCS